MVDGWWKMEERREVGEIDEPKNWRPSTPGEGVARLRLHSTFAATLCIYNALEQAPVQILPETYSRSSEWNKMAVYPEWCVRNNLVAGRFTGHASD